MTNLWNAPAQGKTDARQLFKCRNVWCRCTSVTSAAICLCDVLAKSLSDTDELFIHDGGWGRSTWHAKRADGKFIVMILFSPSFFKWEVILTGDRGEHIVHGSSSLARHTLITLTQPGNERLNPSFVTFTFCQRSRMSRGRFFPQTSSILLASRSFLTLIFFESRSFDFLDGDVM